MKKLILLLLFIPLLSFGQEKRFHIEDEGTKWFYNEDGQVFEGAKEENGGLHIIKGVIYSAYEEWLIWEMDILKKGWGIAPYKSFQEERKTILCTGYIDNYNWEIFCEKEYDYDGTLLSSANYNFEKTFDKASENPVDEYRNIQGITEFFIGVNVNAYIKKYYNHKFRFDCRYCDMSTFGDDGLDSKSYDNGILEEKLINGVFSSYEYSDSGKLKIHKSVKKGGDVNEPTEEYPIYVKKYFDNGKLLEEGLAIGRERGEYLKIGTWKFYFDDGDVLKLNDKDGRNNQDAIDLLSGIN